MRCCTCEHDSFRRSVNEWFQAEDYTQYKLFMGRADPHFKLVSKGQPEIEGRQSSLHITDPARDIREIEIKFERAEFEKMREGATYHLTPINSNDKYRWTIADNIRVTKPMRSGVFGK